jgi:trypsin
MLLKLSTESKNTPVKINSNPSSPLNGDELTVIGWGTTKQGVNRPPSALQEVAVEAITNTACRGSYSQSAVSSDMLCCDETGRGACQGDSGGPLIYKGSGASDDVMFGSVSWGYDCALPGYPGKLSVSSTNL